MVIRVHGAGSSMFGLLNYNENKVEKGEAEIIGHSGMLFPLGKDPSEISFGRKLNRFEKNIDKNDRIKKPTFHASINPSVPDFDKLDDKTVLEIAKNYMKQMGYGNTPFLLYKHNDTDRPHYHIVGTRIDDFGKKVNDSHELAKSERIRVAISKEYGFTTDQKISNPELKIDTQKIEYGKTDITSLVKRGVKASLELQPNSWKEYKTSLNELNIGYTFINAEGKSGLLYHVLDSSKKRQGVAIKSSLFCKEFGLNALKERFTNGPAQTINKQLKDYSKAESVLNSIYREKRREGTFYFESDLIKNLPKQKEDLTKQLLAKIPALKDNGINLVGHYINLKENTLKTVLQKEQGYFEGTTLSLLKFTNNFKENTPKNQIASFLKANQLEIDKKNGFNIISHSKGGEMKLQLETSKFTLPNTLHVEAQPLKKSDRDLIAAFSDPTKMENFLNQNGHQRLVKNPLFDMLKTGSQQNFMRNINSQLARTIPENATLQELFIKGFSIQSSIPPTIGYYSLNKESSSPIPSSLNSYFRDNKITDKHIEQYNGLMFDKNGKPRPLYSAMVGLNDAMDKKDKENIQKAIIFIQNINNQLGNSLLNTFNQTGGNEDFKTRANSEIFNTLVPMAEKEQETRTAYKDEKNVFEAISGLFNILPTGHEGGVKAGGAPTDKIRGKKLKKRKPKMD